MDHLLSVGELATRTHLTVRTLHHWDELGVLSPSERTGAGHRRYAPGDVERLYRVVALRRLGLSLEAVKRVLDEEGEADLADLVARQLAATEQRLAAERRLRALLEGVLDGLGRGERPGLDTTIEVITMTEQVEQHYTQEQLAWLSERREQLGEDAIREVEREWERLFATLREALAAGTPPADPSLAPVARRSRELVAAFHGGREDVRASLGEVWAQEDPEQVSRGLADRRLFAFMGEVQAAHPG